VLQVMLLALPALALVSVGTVATAVRASARAKLIAILGGIVAFVGSSPWLIARFQAVGAAGALALGLMVYAVILFAFIRHDLRLRWSALMGLMALALPLLAARPLIRDRFDLAVAASLVAAVAYVGLALGLRLLSPAPLRLVPRLLRKDAGR
ncbi:MAG: polysaccharide biosynthesis C-terminal domain-containing protein, partial [Caldilineales bacterium]|nr:polysaccharide biosynthesis C-terminal domain-containing protein [Caldilineales bacterium]